MNEGLKEEVTRKKKEKGEARVGVGRRGWGVGYSSYRLYRPCCSNRLGCPFSSLTLDHGIILKDYPHRGGGREGLSNMHIQFYFFKFSSTSKKNTL